MPGSSAWTVPLLQWKNQIRLKQQYFFTILLFAYIFIIFAVIIIFKIGYRLAEKELRSAAIPSRQISSAGSNLVKSTTKLAESTVIIRFVLIFELKFKCHDHVCDFSTRRPSRSSTAGRRHNNLSIPSVNSNRSTATSSNVLTWSASVDTSASYVE